MDYYYCETYKTSARTPSRPSESRARVDLEALGQDGELYRATNDQASLLASSRRKLAEYHANEGWSDAWQSEVDINRTSASLCNGIQQLRKFQFELVNRVPALQSIEVQTRHAQQAACVLLGLDRNEANMRLSVVNKVAQALIQNAVYSPISNETRSATADEEEGMAWWNALTEAARAQWLTVVGTGVAADAWAEYKRRASPTVEKAGDRRAE